MIVKSESEVLNLRVSGRILIQTLMSLREKALPGVTLLDLDQYARELLQAASVRSAFLGYVPEWSGKAYPAALCTSLNEEIVHGLPRKRELEVGDVLKIDLGVEHEGLITDAAITVVVGDKYDSKVDKLVKTTYQALQAGVDAVKAGGRVSDIGRAIYDVADRAGFKVFKNLTGHGVGRKLHEEPTIWNYDTGNQGVLLKEGMVLAIEPMVSMGSSEIEEAPFQAFRTKDGSIAAHFEKTVLVTGDGCEVLTPYSL